MKAIIATIAFATLSFGAFASEATQFDAAAGTLTRAQVKAATLKYDAARHFGDSTSFIDIAPRGTSTVSRAEVRAQAIAAAHSGNRGPGLSYGEAVAF